MKIKSFIASIFLMQLVFVGCSTTSKKDWGKIDHGTPAPSKSSVFYERGYASYYGKKWKGRKTANGEIYDSDLLTAASKTLPFNTRVLVKDLKTGRYVVVRINDRGPYIKGRVIDLSEAAAKKLGIHSHGVARVDVYILKDSSANS